jgi:dihydroneopterin aldolase
MCCSEIQQVVEGPAKVLQEAVAEEAAQRLLALDQRVSAVQLYIRKPHVALPGMLDSIGGQRAMQSGTRS